MAQIGLKAPDNRIADIGGLLEPSAALQEQAARDHVGLAAGK